MKKKIALILMLGTAVAAQAQKNDSLRVKNLDNVVVTGTRSATTTRLLPTTVTIVDREVLTANERANVMPTLTEMVPGLFTTERGMMGYGVSGDAAGGINVRGMSSTGRMLVLVDGHPQYNGVYGHSIADSYQTMMAERVEVVRGPASVLYGSNAMGGVINIITRKAKEDGVRTHVNLGAGSYGTFQSEISNEVRSGRFSSTVALQYGRSDNHRPRMGFEQYGGYVRLGYDISSHWNVFADIDVTHWNASQPGKTTSPLLEADQWITRGVATLAFENHYDRLDGRISVYDNFGIHKLNDGHAPGAAPKTELFRSKDALAGVSWYQTYSYCSKGGVTFGMDYQHIYGKPYYTSRADGHVVTTGQRGMQSTHAHNNEWAGYVDVRHDLASWLTVDAGVRYDYHNVAGDEWVPQAGLVVRPMDGGELKAMVSKGFRNPTTKDLYLYKVANDDSLHAERMWNYEVAWSQRLMGGRFSYGVNLFIIDADNMIQTVAGRNVNTGKLNNRGAELEAAWRVCPSLTLTTNHSMLHIHDHIAGAPEYKGYFGAAWKHGKWSVNAGVMQICGLYTDVGTANDPQEDFTLVNATVGYQLCPNLRLWAKGDNLLAQEYETYRGFPMPRATFMGGVNIRF